MTWKVIHPTVRMRVISFITLVTLASIFFFYFHSCNFSVKTNLLKISWASSFFKKKRNYHFMYFSLINFFLFLLKKQTLNESDLSLEVGTLLSLVMSLGFNQELKKAVKDIGPFDLALKLERVELQRPPLVWGKVVLIIREVLPLLFLATSGERGYIKPLRMMPLAL